MSDIFITGNSSGLGLGLTEYYLNKGDRVYSSSRSICPIQHDNLIQVQHDLSDLSGIQPMLKELLPQQLDLVILNAGILGEIQDLADTSLEQVQQVMDINVWANKIIMDWIIQNQVEVKQIIFISSGASVNGNRGWGVYSISKASVNMMAKLYAAEMPNSHITALAPGIIQTQMQDYLCKDVDSSKFTSIQFLANAYNTDDMPDVPTAARNLAESFNQCLQHDSGSFLDIRQL